MNNKDISKWHQTVDDFINNNIDKRNPVEMLSQTPLVMELVGAKPLPIEITVSTMRKVLEKHNFPVETLKQIPQALAEPIMIFESATNNNLVFMLDLKDRVGATIVVPIILDKTSHKNYQVNEVASIYGRTKPLSLETSKGIQEPYDEWFIEQIKKGNLKYIDQKKSQAWAEPDGLYLPMNFNRLDNINIYTDVDLVKFKEKRAKMMQSKASEKIYLKVHFLEKGKVKELGAQWDKENKAWFVPEQENLMPFKKWLPQEIKAKLETKKSILTPEEEFAIKLREMGLDVDVAVMDGQVHRVPLIDKNRGKDGAYCGYLDGRPAGWATNFVTGEKITFTSQAKVQSQQIDREKLELEKLQKIQARENERIRLHNEVAEKSKLIFAEAKQALTHPYLEKKGIQAYNTRLNEQNQLVIAIRDVNNDIRGLQYINENGSKFYEKGMEKQGNFAKIGGEVENKVLLCEGFATGASLHEATKLPVIIAFDKGNLVEVAKKVREQNPKAKMYICADNDHELPLHIGNVGIEKAKEACKAVDAILKYPKIEKSGITDFNDIHLQYGIKEVEKQLGIVQEQKKSLEKTYNKTRGLVL